MSSIGIKPELIVRARIIVLHDVIRELVQSFSVDYPSTAIETIKKGILEKQYFKAINIYFLNKSNEKVAEIIIDIDWQLHTAKVTSNENTYMIDKTKSVHEQISDLFPVLVKHVSKMKNVLGVIKTEVWYTWRTDISNDKEKYSTARKELGFSEVKSSPPVWASAANNSHPDNTVIELVSESLEELKVTLKHNLK